jgi:hypothetical protein
MGRGGGNPATAGHEPKLTSGQGSSTSPGHKNVQKHRKSIQAHAQPDTLE